MIRLTPRTDHVDGCFVARLIEAATKRLAVQGDQLSPASPDQALHLFLKTLFQLVGVQPTEDPTERIMRGNAER